MKKQRSLIKIGNMTYMSPKAAGDLWNMKYQSVTAACVDGRVIGAIKDSSDKFIIPIDAFKPLDKEEIRKLMITTLYLKNRPSFDIGFNDNEQIVKLYTYLEGIGYIEPFNSSSNKIPYEAILTDKGMHLATEGGHVDIDWCNIGITVIQIAASMITIGQAAAIIL